MKIKWILSLAIAISLGLISTSYAAVGDIDFNIASNISTVSEVFVEPVNRSFVMVTASAVGNTGVIRAAQLTQAQINPGTQLIVGFEVRQFPNIQWVCPASTLLTYSATRESLASMSLNGFNVNCRFS